MGSDSLQARTVICTDELYVPVSLRGLFPDFPDSYSTRGMLQVCAYTHVCALRVVATRSHVGHPTWGTKKLLRARPVLGLGEDMHI